MSFLRDHSRDLLSIVLCMECARIERVHARSFALKIYVQQLRAQAVNEKRTISAFQSILIAFIVKNTIDFVRARMLALVNCVFLFARKIVI